MMSPSEILPGKTILIVDDEPDLREPLVSEFESLGCRVHAAGNGREAFEIVRREKIDAVVSDIRMPGGDGIELLKKIKTLHHEVPMVMLITGFSDLSREEAYDLGAEAILSKPFDLDELDAAVTRILTPRETRWSCPIETEKLKHSLQKTLKEFGHAVATGDFSLGRGGFFLKASGIHPLPGQLVSIQVRFQEGNVLLLDGTGVVRWIRREDSKGLPAGCGVEFESLSAESRAAVAKLTSELRTKPYIPKM